MNTGSETRERVLDAAARLFADAGYRGASVRDICNLAGANPGAVSYHFGGKRQLYRAVLRRAASSLAAAGSTPDGGTSDAPPDFDHVVLRVLRRVVDEHTAASLLLRDLADGGSAAVESLTPPLRTAFQQIAVATGEGDAPHAGDGARRLFLALAAPLFLLTAAWPVIARVLELEDEQREALLEDLARRALGIDSRHQHGSTPEITHTNPDR